MRRLLIVGAVVLAVAYLLTGVVQVRPGERAVVRRFGRVLEYKPGPGLWVGLPWGMDRVDREEVDRLRTVEVGYRPGAGADAGGTPPGQLLTGDHNLVNVEAAVHYTVAGDEVERFVVEKDRVEELVARAAEAVLAEWVGGRAVDEVLVSGKAVLPGVLVAGVQERLAPYRLGIRVRDASAVPSPPDEVRSSFAAVAEAQTRIRTQVYQAEEAAQAGLRRAEQAKFHAEQQAAAYAGEQRLLAQADAAAFERRLEQYRRLRQENPHVLTAIWYDEMGKLFARMRQDGRIDLLDRHLGADGLDITVMPPLPRKK